MRGSGQRAAAAALVAAGALLAACHKSAPPAAGTTIGPAGGTVQGDGVTLFVPQGALASTVNLQIAVSDTGATDVSGRVLVSRVALITPERTAFLVPVTVTLAYDPAKVPAGVAAALCDLRRTGVSRAVERLSSIAVDPSAAAVSGDALALGTFFATAPQGRVATAVAVTPSAVAVREGQTAQLAAVVRDQDGLVMADAPVAWSVGNAKVASVDAAGLAHALRAGTSTVVARSGAAQGAATLKVTGISPYPKSFAFANPLPGANDLFAVKGDASRLVVAGANGQIAELGAAGWTTLAAQAGTEFHDLSVDSEEVVAVGSSGGQGIVSTVALASTTSAAVADTELLSIWLGSAGGMAVGAGPNLALLDLSASSWAAASSPLSEDLLAVGAAADEPMVVGARGSVYRWSQGAWVDLALTPLTQLQLNAVVRGDEAYAVSASAVRHFVQGAWSAVSTPVALAFTAVGASPDAVAVAGAAGDGTAQVLLDAGQGFQPFALGADPVYALWGRSASDFWAAGKGGAVWHFDGSAWTSKSQGPSADVAALAVLDSARVYAAANTCADSACSSVSPAVLARGADGRFAPMDGAGALKGRLASIAADGAGDLWAVGSGGAFVYQSGAWAPAAAAGLPASGLDDVASCGGALYVAGASGLSVLGAGGAFEAVSSVSGSLRALACSQGALFAAGDYVIVQVAGGVGTVLDPAADDLRQAAWTAAWASPDGELFVGGEARWILHFDGEHFEAFDRPGNLSVARVSSLWGSGFGDVWAAGDLEDGSSFLVHFDGVTWTPQDPGLARGLRAVRGLPGGEVWLGGERGALLRGTPP